jgi:hypothetical protein
MNINDHMRQLGSELAQEMLSAPKTLEQTIEDELMRQGFNVNGLDHAALDRVITAWTELFDPYGPQA